MKSINLRRLLGLILMGIGLLFGAIYASGQLNTAARSVSTPQPNYGPLVPTSIVKAPTPTNVAPITITLIRSPRL